MRKVKAFSRKGAKSAKENVEQEKYKKRIPFLAISAS